jgi:putative hydrolase of the HAD superfamily
MEQQNKKALIFDLDNTIYPVSSIGEDLFRELFEMIEEDGRFEGNFEDVKDAIQRKPFQVVAEDFKFHEELTSAGLDALTDLEYRNEMEAFDDFEIVRKIDRMKFLVTTGFTKLQWSKIRLLNLEPDFEACFVVDPAKSSKTKKDIFAEIMSRYGLTAEDLLVIGDDIHSEIQAGKELGIQTVLYDFASKHMEVPEYTDYVITNFNELLPYI